jgi:hypothetical protein
MESICPPVKGGNNTALSRETLVGSFFYKLPRCDVDPMTILKIHHRQCGLIGIKLHLEHGITRACPARS